MMLKVILFCVIVFLHHNLQQQEVTSSVNPQYENIPALHSVQSMKNVLLMVHLLKISHLSLL